MPGKQHYVDLTGFEKILQEAGSGACPRPRLRGGISGPLQLTRGHQDTKANGSPRLNTHKNAFAEVCVRSHVTAPASRAPFITGGLKNTTGQSPSELYSLVKILQVH